MIEGILPSIPTPFSGDDVAYDKLTENITRWNRTGLRGCLVLGYYGGPVRSPLRPLGQAELVDLDQILVNAGLVNVDRKAVTPRPFQNEGTPR